MITLNANLPKYIPGQPLLAIFDCGFTRHSNAVIPASQQIAEIALQIIAVKHIHIGATNNLKDIEKNDLIEYEIFGETP
ncbi:hypothetical protein SDC9_191048 [bioreactor metagenome]|uniref:Uncharacterized protein n=1 Tax=bioreactor metagenome TaxID=1076179 RepID=A0A645HWU5_9ZZZZ